MQTRYNKTTATHNREIIALAQQVGGFPKLAIELGVHWTTLYRLSRGEVPANFRRMVQLGHYASVSNGLLRLTGRTILEVFCPKTNYQPKQAKQAQALPWQQYDAIDFALDLPKLIQTLDSRERAVLFRRMDGISLDAIGAELGVTRETIRQVELRACRKVCYQANRLGYRRENQ